MHITNFDTTLPIELRHWHDELVQRNGWPADSLYVERFWLSIIGPTALWIYRDLNRRIDAAMLSIEDRAAHARRFGLNATTWTRGLHRLAMFGLAHSVTHETCEVWHVRSHLPNVAARHVSRWPVDMQLEHDVELDSRRVELAAR